MWFSALFGGLRKDHCFPGSVRSARRYKSLLASPEGLEPRLLLYAVSGNAWPAPALVTISFMPDGTSINGQSSNLFSTFNTKFGTVATWQNQILKAAQQWAQQTNINFAVVSDNGTATGSGSNQQGDPGFGDIRIGGYNFGTSTLAQAYLPPPVNNYSIAGDMQFNTGTTFNVGSTYDLFTVATHEFGHALGVLHSTTTAACMYAAYSSVKSALNSDDITGIKSIYSAGAVRAKDSYDATDNGTTAKASVITTSINTTTKAAVINGLDLTTTSDLDFYKFVTPAGSATTLKAIVVSQGLSLLNPKVEILDSAGIVKATATGNAYGTTITATLTGIAAGQTYFVKVSSADAIPAFKTGKYALVLNMGTGIDPVPAYPVTLKANGSPLTAGGGQAILLTPEFSVNVTTASDQVTSDRAVAASPTGEFVVTWAGLNQDGSGWGVYARRYNRSSEAQGNEFLVNTTTLGDQVDPTVAMDAFGNFVITWASLGQDGSGWGIYAQRFTANGMALGAEFRVNTKTDSDQSAPSVACNGLGNFVITWTSRDQDGSDLGIYAQRYDLSGLAAGGEFRVNTFTAGAQSDSAVAMNLLNSEFIVTWSSTGQDGSGSGIYAQRYNANGGSAGSEFRVNTTTANDQIDPQIANNRLNGSFIITWSSRNQDGSGLGIYAQRFSVGGVAQGAEFRVNTTTAGDQSDSAVAMDAAGNIFVTWTSLDANVDRQVYGQQISSNGQLEESQFVVNNTTNGDQQSSSVAIDFLGNVIVVWCGYSVADSNGVSAARYRTDLNKFEAHEHTNDHDHTQKNSQHNTDASSLTHAETGSRPVATHALMMSLDDTANHWEGLLSAIDDLMFGKVYVNPRGKPGGRRR